MGTVWECLFYRREKVNLYFFESHLLLFVVVGYLSYTSVVLC